MQGIVIKKMADKFWLNSNSEVIICTARGILKENGIFVGDRVEFDENELNITQIFERRNLLIRPPLANLDQLFIILADKPKPDYYILDKMLLFCAVNGAQPIICLNKCDISRKNLKYLTEVYGRHYKVIEISAHANKNIDQIMALTENKISAFAGQSGVGKSALINAILGDNHTKEGELSEKITRGKNTTRHVWLYELKKDSFLADTPGFSALDEKYLPITAEKLPYYYPDFLEYLPNCDYKSCLHNKEQVCGIKSAVKAGKLDENRYNRYLIFLNNLINKNNY